MNLLKSIWRIIISVFGFLIVWIFLPEPFGTYNYICDVSANTRGVNYRGRWTAEISGWSEHFLTYIAALEGLQNKFEEQ